jgi:signal transduction histidine kinase/CheY-like chemotaxis protein
MRGVDTELASINKYMELLKTALADSITSADVTLLHSLVTDKLRFTNTIIEKYKTEGALSAQAFINTGRGQSLRDSILLVINNIDTNRQKHTKQVIADIEASGVKARFWGFSLAVIACIACMLAFLYVVNKGRQQQRSIALLNESEKKIKEAAHVKEQFLANMSHEIRTPMNAILGFTNLLKKTELNPHQHQYVEYIYSSGENLLTLINDILDLSKIEAGMMNIEEAPFSLNGLIDSVDIMFREKATAKGLHFKIDIDPSIPDTLNGDAVRLTQVLINLLSNAIKFTEKGEVGLSVEVVDAAAHPLLLRFRVKDTGVGVPADKRKTIFDRFQQAEAQTTRRYGGTGLGLSIVKQLVDLQGGAIELNSTVGHGSEFIVSLQFTPVADHTVSHAAPIAELRPQLPGIKILVAEDNQMNQQLIQHLMKQWGVSFRLVNNGSEAIEALKHSSFSMILMDVQMPVIDGYAATQAIRKELKLDVPIVAMTAHAMPGEKERCLSYGMTDYISKPVRETELYAILQLYATPVTPNEEDDKMVNLDYLRELSMGDTEFENTIIRQFIIQVPEELASLQEAIERHDPQQIKSIAHGMKSSVAYLGLNDRLHPFLHRMEVEAVSGDTTHFEEDYKEVKRVCEQAIVEARDLVQVTI